MADYSTPTQYRSGTPWHARRPMGPPGEGSWLGGYHGRNAQRAAQRNDPNYVAGAKSVPGMTKDAAAAGPNTTGGAPDPGKGGAYAGVGTTPPAAGPSPYGSQSGPGILENWFIQRAAGTDPAFEYAANRGMEDLGNQYSAAGSFNSGAARRGESDFYANLVAQRMGQLDSLAGGASAEHQGRLNSMFGQGQALAAGKSSLASAYDLGAAGNMDAANRARMEMNLNKAGVDSKANGALWNNILSAYAIGNSGGK